MAMPTSAGSGTGASLMPSPTKAWFSLPLLAEELPVRPLCRRGAVRHGTHPVPSSGPRICPPLSASPVSITVLRTPFLLRAVMASLASGFTTSEMMIWPWYHSHPPPHGRRFQPAHNLWRLDAQLLISLVPPGWPPVGLPPTVATRYPVWPAISSTWERGRWNPVPCPSFSGKGRWGGRNSLHQGGKPRDPVPVACSGWDGGEPQVALGQGCAGFQRPQWSPSARASR